MASPSGHTMHCSSLSTRPSPLIASGFKKHIYPNPDPTKAWRRKPSKGWVFLGNQEQALLSTHSWGPTQSELENSGWGCWSAGQSAKLRPLGRELPWEVAPEPSRRKRVCQ